MVLIKEENIIIEDMKEDDLFDVMKIEKRRFLIHGLLICFILNYSTQFLFLGGKGYIRKINWIHQFLEGS